jgi:probable F420-dependent oxidoreductase
MKFGVAMFATEYAIPPDELARALEERGFESIWIPEHTHIPADRRSPWPGGGDLPKEYWYTYDPFLALTAAGAVTKTLRLGTGICLVVERDPITTAKEVATLDRLSNGRFIFGIGGGWNAEEMEHHGTAFKTRFAVLRERMLAMKKIWTENEPSYRGDYVNFDRIWSWPKPVQQPHPPILMGGDGATTFDRVVEFCDGWLPLLQGRPSQKLVPKLEVLRQRMKDAGRDPKSLDVSVFGVRPQKPIVDELAAAGVTRTIFMIPSEPRDAALTKLDALVPLTT